MKPRRSHFPSVNLNLNVRGLTPSATLAINEKSNHLRAEGSRVVKLGLGQSPFPVPAPVVEALKANAHQKDYLPVKGLPALREAVAGYHARRHGIEASGDDVLIGPGSKELMFLIQLVYYGDLVIPAPSWVSYAPQAQIIGRQIRWVQTSPENDWRMMPGDLERLCAADPDRPRLLILNYPSNPTGATYRSEELKALAQVARKYRVILLSDEIYGELHHTGRHVSIARYYPEGTIISSGLSKWCGAGGWRLGTFLFPPSLRWLLDAMAVVASETFTATSAPIQYAAVTAFQGGMALEQYLVQARRILRCLARSIVPMVREAGGRLADPQGGFYLFPDFEALRPALAARGIATGRQLAERLLEEVGVATLPGVDFGRPEQELTLRLAYVDFDGARTLAEAEQIDPDKELGRSFLCHHCGDMIDGVARMGDWLKG